MAAYENISNDTRGRNNLRIWKEQRSLTGRVKSIWQNYKALIAVTSNLLFFFMLFEIYFRVEHGKTGIDAMGWLTNLW